MLNWESKGCEKSEDCFLRDSCSGTLQTSINHVSAVRGVQLSDIACDADLRTDIVVTSGLSPTPGVVLR